MPGDKSQIQARRYGQAAFELATEAGALDRWQKDLAALTALLGDAEVAAFLDSPGVCLSDKRKIISSQMKNIDPLAAKMVYLLITRHQLRLLPDIAAEFKRLLDEQRGVVAGEVATAVPITSAEKAKLAGELGQLIDRRVELSSRVEPALIGGMVARIGDKLIDGSIRSALASLEQNISQGRP